MKILTRKQKLLKKIDLTKKGLEIGPLCWPLLTKQEANIQYVDFTSTDNLKKVYGNDPGVDLNLIVEIDYPLEQNSLLEVVGKTKKFDYIIASHVIEHIPDMIRWLQDMASVLKTGGSLSLAIPDKNYTFDIDRHPSSPGDAVGAYIDKLTSPSSAMLYDYASNFRLSIQAKKIWAGKLYIGNRAPHRYSPHQAYQLCLDNKKSYVDTHCHVFTPYSFFEILKALIELDLLPFSVNSFFNTAINEYEFIVTLEKIDGKVSKTQQLESLPQLNRDKYYRELKAEILLLKQKLTYTETEVSKIRDSRLWKATKPLRSTIKFIRKVKKR